MENLEKTKRNNKINHTKDYTPFSRDVHNYLTTKASTVKMDMYNCVQWPFVLNYSSRFGTVRVVMRHLWRPICHWCSVGWMDRLGCLHCHSCFIIRWYKHCVAYCKSTDTKSFLKGHFTEIVPECPVLSKAYSGTIGCNEDIIGRSRAQMEAFLCFQCG